MQFPDMTNLFNRLPRFGDQLRDYRTLRGLTVDQIAAAAGLAPAAIRDMEAGKRSAPSKEIASALADALRLGKEERREFLNAADLESPVMNALLGRQTAKPARPPLTAAILVFLIADIRDYTRFTQERGDEVAARLTARFADLARAAVERWDGQLVEVRGDEILAVFASARSALRAAQDLHARCADETATHPDMPLAVGIGLDIGEAVPVEDGYRGAALNRAARLCALAGPGEILVSTGVVYVAPHVEGVTYVGRGQERLKGFDGPIPVLLAAPSDAVDADADDSTTD